MKRRGFAHAVFLLVLLVLMTPSFLPLYGLVSPTRGMQQPVQYGFLLQSTRTQTSNPAFGLIVPEPLVPRVPLPRSAGNRLLSRSRRKSTAAATCSSDFPFPILKPMRKSSPAGSLLCRPAHRQGFCTRSSLHV